MFEANKAKTIPIAIKAKRRYVRCMYIHITLLSIYSCLFYSTKSEIVLKIISIARVFTSDEKSCIEGFGFGYYTCICAFNEQQRFSSACICSSDCEIWQYQY